MWRRDLVEVLEGIGRPRILVLGDLILDRYTRGDADRVSPEAPVVVLRAGQREERLGGAANVANMLRELEAEVVCGGVIGKDETGDRVARMLHGRGVETDLVVVDPDRPTTLKERFIGLAGTRHPSQMLRVDHESTDPLPPELEEQAIRRLTECIGGFSAVLISDYGKGFCTPRIVRAAIDGARRRGAPVLVDPAPQVGFERYRGASLVKPNRREAELAIGETITSPSDALGVGRKLCSELNLETVVITLDRDGMALVPRHGKGEVFPTSARSVYDITGAGDMVLAMLGLCLADGVEPEDAALLANVAAGLEVEREGVAVVSRAEIRQELLISAATGERKIITRREAAALAESHRKAGRTVVFTNGCFDLLHVGHVTCLAEAASMGDVLIVGINSDESVRRLKGPSRPIIGQNERAAMLAALECVDHVVIFEEDTPARLLSDIRPDLLVKGGATAADEVACRELVECYGGQVRLTSKVDGLSTTGILASMAERGEAREATLAASDSSATQRVSARPR